MKQVWIFYKKEWRANLANYHFYMLVGVFIVFALLSVLTAKFTPQLIESLVSAELAATFPAPSGIDVWLQFHKNVSQLGLIIVVLLCSNILTKEYQQETLPIILSKGLSRWTVLLAKWLLMVVNFSVAYLISIGTTILYTTFYFEQVFYGEFWWAVFCLWLFSIFLFSVITLGSVLFKQNYAVLCFIAGVIVACILLNMITDIQKFNPMQMMNQFLPLLNREIEVVKLFPSVMTIVILMVGCLGTSIVLFKKKLI